MKFKNGENLNFIEEVNMSKIKRYFLLIY